MSFLYVPGTGGSISDCESRRRLLARSVGWRGKLRPAKSWSRACRKGGWIRLLFGQMPRPSTASLGVESWIASLRESRANPGASPESGKASTTTDTWASTLSAPLARWVRDSSSWRTSPGLFDSDCPTFSGDWPTSGMTRSGACFPLPESAPLIDGNESSCWPTATAGDSKATGSAAYSTESGRHSGTTLTDAMKAWATPQARDYRGPDAPSSGNYKRKKAAGWGIDLNSQAAAWATPTARDWKDGACRDAAVPTKGHLGRQAPRATGLESPLGSTQRLNPAFVEWLMGLPEGWTDSECSATEWSRWLLLMRSALCSNGQSAQGVEVER